MSGKTRARPVKHHVVRIETQVDGAVAKEQQPTAEVIANALGAAEMLSGSVVDAAKLISTFLSVGGRAEALREVKNKLSNALRVAQQENMNLPQFGPGLQQAITIISNLIGQPTPPASARAEREALRDLLQYAEFAVGAFDAEVSPRNTMLLLGAACMRAKWVLTKPPLARPSQPPPHRERKKHEN